MGSFYGNVTLLDTDLDTMRSAGDVPAFVAGIGGDVAVSSGSDDQGSPPARPPSARDIGTSSRRAMPMTGHP